MQRLLATACVALLASALVSCVPVATLAGRPASVLSDGEQAYGLAVGGFYYEQESDSDLDTAGGGPYAYGTYDFGMPWRSDMRVALIGAQGIAVQVHVAVRTQVIGEPEDDLSMAGPAVSLEVGGGVGGLSSHDSDYYLGANASWLVVDTTAYLTYRRHFGNTRDSDVDYAFDLHMLYLGVMFGMFDDSMAVELFAGWPDDHTLGPDEAAYGTVGLNVAFRKSEW